jgi:hypothetical protein
MLGELNCKYPGAAHAPLDKNALSGIETSNKATTAIESPHADDTDTTGLQFSLGATPSSHAR